MENKNCVAEAEKLEQLKSHLEKDLEKLEVSTLRKEQKLKMNIKANETLSKYKNVYENLTKTTRGQTIFINGETENLSSRIADLQRELEDIAGQNQKYQNLEQQKSEIMNELKQQNEVLTIKSRDILYYVKEIAKALEKVSESPEN